MLFVSFSEMWRTTYLSVWFCDLSLVSFARIRTHVCMNLFVKLHTSSAGGDEMRLQNHRMVGFCRKEPLEIQSNLSQKQVPYRQVTQIGIEMSLEYLHRRRLYNLSRQPVPALRRSDSKKVLPPVTIELPVFQFLPATSCSTAARCL